jgi:hypothetical protein
VVDVEVTSQRIVDVSPADQEIVDAVEEVMNGDGARPAPQVEAPAPVPAPRPDPDPRPVPRAPDGTSPSPRPVPRGGNGGSTPSFKPKPRSSLFAGGRSSPSNVEGPRPVPKETEPVRKPRTTRDIEELLDSLDFLDEE